MQLRRSCWSQRVTICICVSDPSSPGKGYHTYIFINDVVAYVGFSVLHWLYCILTFLFLQHNAFADAIVDDAGRKSLSTLSQGFILR
jgi:hypothetical protein